MRRLIPILALLCLAIPTHATITVTQNGSATATSATITSTAFSDLILVCADRASNTAPSLATGYTAIQSGGANTQSSRCGYKFSTGGETTTSTWTNAAKVAYIVVRGYDMASAGPIGCKPAISNGSSTSNTFTACTLTRTDGTSMLVTFAGAEGASTTGPDSCPTGPVGGTMTLASNTAQSTIGLCYLIGVTSAATINAVTISPSTGHNGITFEILGAEPASSASSYLVDSNYSPPSGEACTTTCKLTVVDTLNGGSQSGNELNLTVFWSYATVNPTITNVQCNSDSGHATWTWSLVQSTTLVSATSNLSDYHIDGATAGCQTITVTFSSVFSGASAYFTEWHGMPISSAVDTSAILDSNATPPFYSAGSITPSVDGDVIYQSCVHAFVWEAGTSSNPVFAEHPATLLMPDNTFQLGGEMFVQSTAASISPYMDLVSQSLDSLCVNIAFKTGSGGTVPSGSQVIAQTQTIVGSSATAHLEFSVQNAGDTLVVLGNSGNVPGTVVACTGISDALGNTWATFKQNAGGSGQAPMFTFDSNAAAGNDYITLTGCATGGNQSWVVMELKGLANSSHTASYDSTMGYCQGTFSAQASPFAFPASCSPSTSSGIVIASIALGTGPVTSVTSSPSGAFFSYPTYTGMTDASQMTLGGGTSILYNTGTGPYTFTFAGDPNTSAGGGSAIHFLAASAGATIVPRRRFGVF